MKDLRGCEVRATGRDGLSAETVLRRALLKQYRQLSYEELTFHLEVSASFVAFARLVAEEVGAPQNDQCDRRGDLRGDQPGADQLRVPGDD